MPFDGEPVGPTSISYIVGQDLTRSGLFKLVDPSGIAPRPVRIEDVQAATWRAKGADAVVVGSARPQADGRVEVRFALVDVVKQAPLVAMVYNVTPAQFRATAHKIADVIYEKMTGDPGRVLDTHRLHHQIGHPVPAAGGRRRRLRAADHRHVE